MKIFDVTDIATYEEKFNLDDFLLSEDVKKLKESEKTSRIVHRVGNYLCVLARVKKGYVNYSWALRVSYVVQTLEKTSREIVTRPFADCSNTDFNSAKDLCEQYIKFMLRNNRLPPISTKKLFCWKSKSDSILCVGYNLDALKLNLNYTDADILKLKACRLNCDTTYTVYPNLAVSIKELILEIKRKYVFLTTNENGNTIKIALGNVESLSFQTAKKLRDYIIEKLSLNYSDTKKVYIERVVRDFYKRLNSNDSFIKLSKSPLQPPLQSKRIYITPDAVNSIYEEYNRFMNEDFKLNVSHIHQSGFSLKEAFSFWFFHWSKTVGEKYAKTTSNLVDKYLRDFMDMNFQELLDQFILGDIVLGLEKINANIARKLLNTIDTIADYSIAIKKIKNNPIKTLKQIVKKRKPIHVKTLNPYALENEISHLFSVYIYNMSTTYRIIYELLFYTLLRSGELLKIKKNQVIFDNDGLGRLITYQNKTLAEFSIPLTKYAQDLFRLQIARDNSGSEYLFPRRTNPCRSINNVLLNDALHRTQCDIIVPHGIRSVGASFFAHNAKEVAYEIGMACLQHSYATKAHLAYDRTFLYEPRKIAMQLWSDYLEKNIGLASVLRKR